MKSNLFLRILTSLILVPLIFFFIYLGKSYFILLLLLILIIGLYEIFRIKNFFIKLSISLLLFFFIYCNYKIINLPNGKFVLFYIFLLTCLSDIGGYVFGRLIGGKKINIISPNKTYSGFLGSILFAQLLALYANILNMKFLNNLLFDHFFVFFCSILVILGDLLFSFFKRKARIKDFSSLIPGHGGLFDRIDGLIILTIFIYISLQ